MSSVGPPTHACLVHALGTLRGTSLDAEHAKTTTKHARNISTSKAPVRSCVEADWSLSLPLTSAERLRWC